MSQIVDTHRHYLPSTLLEVFARRQAPPCLVSTGGGGRGVDCGAGHVTPVASEMVDIERQLERMDEYGIDMAVLAVTLPGVDHLPTGDAVIAARECNDELTAVCGRWPSRLAGLAVLPVQAPEHAAQELERAMAIGMVGAQVFGNVAGEELYSERFRPVLEAAAQREAPLRIHPSVRHNSTPNHGGPVRTTLGHVFDSSTAALGLILSGLFDRHPDFKLIVPHVGGVLPYLTARTDYEVARSRQGGKTPVGDQRAPSEDLARVYTDTACASPLSLSLALQVFDDGHVMFGTDFPVWKETVAFGLLADSDLGDEQRVAIQSGAAEGLFGLRSDRPALPSA